MDLSFLNENQGLKAEIQLIKEKILFILDKVHHNRYYINKHFQNCMINYFLRNLNFQFLSDSDPEFTCSKTMNNAILKKYINSEGAIYLRLLKGYLLEIQNLGKLQIYRQTLVGMIMHDSQGSKSEKKDAKQNNTESDSKINKDDQSEIWKKAFSLFVLFHSYNQNIKGIFEIWNSLFPKDQIKRKRKQNINHIIVVPNRTMSIETKSEEVDDVDNEEEEQEFKKQNFNFNQKASSGFQFYGIENYNNINNNTNNHYDYLNDNYPLAQFQEIHQFSHTTMCSSHSNLQFSNISVDSSLFSSSNCQEIKIYDDEINYSPQNDQNQISGSYDEIQTLQPDLNKPIQDVTESDNFSIQDEHRNLLKIKLKRQSQQNTESFEHYSLGRKIPKRQQNSQSTSTISFFFE